MRKFCDQTLHERAEVFVTEYGVAGDSPDRECVDRILPGNGDDPNIVGHHDVLALPGDPKARFL